MWTRRELIGSLLGATALTVGGCRSSRLPSAGKLYRTRFDVGHKIRDAAFASAGDSISPKRSQTVIIGGGVAGLAAAWRLAERGLDDFVVLDLEDVAGGTAKSGRTDGFDHPWGAHYVPVPMKQNQD